MRHQKRTVAVARAKRRVIEYHRQDAPWLHKMRALRQLRRAETKEASHARMD